LACSGAFLIQTDFPDQINAAKTNPLFQLIADSEKPLIAFAGVINKMRSRM